MPFLKVVNDTAVAVNQGGKRKGAVCSYLETWHLDIEEFLELRKNTGDDRRRTHDMNTANWIPDLFMKRVMEGGDWTLFSPSDVPDLHDKWGREFEEAYTRYEEKAARGELKLFKKIPALQLWRKMLSMLFETGHPWITFKDACNVRSPQSHVGAVHSSNLCTEITLNTSETEIAVCNLGSVNLLAHMKKVGKGETAGSSTTKSCKQTIRTAMRMLDNVIDINYYAVREGAQLEPASTARWAWASWASRIACTCCTRRTRRTRRWSSPTARWKRSATTPTGPRPSSPRSAAATRSYKGSLWDRGILPQDSLKLLRDERGGYVEIDESATMDWDALRARIKEHGMRNSNCVAIAPTATISNIIGVGASIEPEYQNIYVKSNLSGEFTVVNEHLVAELKKLDLWDEVMVADLKYFDGSLAKIDRVPAELRNALRDRVRSRRDVDRRGGRAPAEMDRPGAVAQHLHGGRVGQEARRDVQARVGARTEDDVLPAHAGGDVGREVDRQGRRAERGVVVGRRDRPRPAARRPRRARPRSSDAQEPSAEVLRDRRSGLRGPASRSAMRPTCESLPASRRARHR